MDNPWNWGVEKVIQETCFSNHTWIRISSLELPSSELLKACLRKQRADSHTIFTYPDEPELRDRLGIKTLKQRSTCMRACSQLRRQSQMYRDYLNDYPTSESKLNPNAHNIGLTTCGPFPYAPAPDCDEPEWETDPGLSAQHPCPAEWLGHAHAHYASECVLEACSNRNVKNEGMRNDICLNMEGNERNCDGS
ncbi:hypothetical protein F5Y09DRAFT_191320 [Xylaria sp. FL1042]|nr:hypothetical protein F5Y09DRAFT_191320 [Xylaria sp. FL1042]